MSDRTTWILHEVYEERLRQDVKWGGPTHDDIHSLNDWKELIRERLDREGLDSLSKRRLLIEAASVAVAAVESLDRAIALAEKEEGSDD